MELWNWICYQSPSLLVTSENEMWVWVGLGFVGWGWPHRDFPWVDGEILFTD